MPIANAIKVADASAVAALLFGEPQGEAVAERLDDARLVAPAPLGFEVANVCLTKMRQHPRRKEALLAAFRIIDRLAVARESRGVHR